MVEDCAQAIGARSAVAGLSGSCRAGALGHASAISFYPTKNVGALGDAGAVLTSDRELAATVRALPIMVLTAAITTYMPESTA